MTSIFNAIGNGFQSFFKILPATGWVLNIIFCALGVFGTAAWIWYMFKKQGEEKGFNH